MQLSQVRILTQGNLFLFLFLSLHAISSPSAVKYRALVLKKKPPKQIKLFYYHYLPNMVLMTLKIFRKTIFFQTRLK